MFKCDYFFEEFLIGKNWGKTSESALEYAYVVSGLLEAAVEVDAVLDELAFVRRPEETQESGAGLLGAAGHLALVEDHYVLPAVLRQVERHRVPDHPRSGDHDLHRQ